MGKKNKPKGIYRNPTSYGDVEFTEYITWAEPFSARPAMTGKTWNVRL